MKRILFLSLILLLTFASKAQSTQTIKGTVLDKQSQESLIGVSVIVVGSDPLVGTTTDEDGKFKLNNLEPGRYELSISYPGYKSQSAANIVLTTGKEIDLDIQLEESVSSTIGDVVITGEKRDVNNELTTVSGRSFTMEDVNRYAGGRSDPARLASNFAGVSSPDDSRNDLVIRGNSPVGVLWRMEGLNIGNPNHFATIGTTGGPVSAINTNLLRNSDFMTSAFPSEYGNANAGVFDLGMRNGNSDKREHTFQFGALTGLEFVTEGPISKEKGSSYLIGYRYGFAGVAQKVGLQIGTAATPYYQDLSFKINSGNTKIGKFTFFGIGALSRIDFLHNEIDSSDLFADPTKDSYYTSQMGIAGLKHTIRLNPKSYVITVFGGSYAASNYLQDSIGANEAAARTIENRTSRLTFTLNSSLNTKLSAKHFLKIGIIAEQLNLDLYYRNREETPYWVQYWDTKEQTYLLQAYVHTKYNFTDNLTLNAGIHTQFLTLNNSFALEPRVGLKWAVNSTNTFSLGYGLHSQMQPLDTYFLISVDSTGKGQRLNEGMGFTKSHHSVIGYEWTPNNHWRIKTEAYYQYLFNIPVEQFASSYSMINAGASFYPNNNTNLVNNGTGQNYGVELTVERYFFKGYYGLITGSVYEAKYTASDNIERNTGFNGRFVYNVLIGKEVKVGKTKKNSFTMDVKFTHAGGRFYTPVDLIASQYAQQQVLKGDDYAFSQKYPDFMRMDVKIGFTLNSTKRAVSQSWYFDVNNVTNRKNIFAERYNAINNEMNTAYQIGFFPNFVYRLQF